MFSLKNQLLLKRQKKWQVSLKKSTVKKISFSAMAFLSDNIFLKIINGQLPADKVYENERILAFKDIAPKAETHIIIIPKEEIITAMDVNEKNKALFGELFLGAKKIAKKLGLKGYKLHMNVGEAGGQVVPHVHLHLLSSDFKTNL